MIEYIEKWNVVGILTQLENELRQKKLWKNG